MNGKHWSKLMTELNKRTHHSSHTHTHPQNQALHYEGPSLVHLKPPQSPTVCGYLKKDFSL